MPLFEEKKHLRRNEMRRALRSDVGKIPKSGRRYTRREREGMEKEVFGREYGSHISRDDYKRAVDKLAKGRHKARGEERRQIERKIRYLKHLGGM